MSEGKYRNIKIRISDPETSRKVQEKLFEDGCCWIGDAVAMVGQTKATHLYVNAVGKIELGTDDSYFIRDEAKEVTPAEILGEQEWVGGLPHVGAYVETDLASKKEPGTFIVSGYHVEGDLGGDAALHRVFVDFVGGNCRMLKDVRPIRTEAERQREADEERLMFILEGMVDSEHVNDVIDDILKNGFTRGGRDE